MSSYARIKTEVQKAERATETIIDTDARGTLEDETRTILRSLKEIERLAKRLRDEARDDA